MQACLSVLIIESYQTCYPSFTHGSDYITATRQNSCSEAVDVRIPVTGAVRWVATLGGSLIPLIVVRHRSLGRTLALPVPGPYTKHYARITIPPHLPPTTPCSSRITMDHNMHPRPRLPIELIDSIAFHLRPTAWDSLHWSEVLDADRGLGSLHACSLVSHQWRAMVLPHLFHSITYSYRREDGLSDASGEGSEDEEDTGSASASASQARFKTVSMLCEFLEADPAVGSWIQRLKLVYWPRGYAVDAVPQHCPDLDAGDVLTDRLFARLLRLVPRMKVLHLHGVLVRQPTNTNDSDPAQIEARALLSLKLSPFDNQAISWVQPDERHTLGDNIAAPLAFFSSVRQLHLSRLVMCWRLDPAIAFPLLRVESLDLDGCVQGLGVFVDALLRSPSVDTIRHLSMHGLREVQSVFDPPRTKLQRLVDTIGPNLETITCHGIKFEPLGSAVVPELSACRNLRKLSAGFVMSKAQMAVPDVCYKTTNLLWSVPATAPLQNVQLRMVFQNISDLGCLPRELKPLDEALVQVVERYKKLLVVNVDCAVEGGLRLLSPSRPYEVAVRKLLPQLQEKRQLHVHCDGC